MVERVTNEEESDSSDEGDDSDHSGSHASDDGTGTGTGRGGGSSSTGGCRRDAAAATNGRKRGIGDHIVSGSSRGGDSSLLKRKIREKAAIRK